MPAQRKVSFRLSRMRMRKFSQLRDWEGWIYRRRSMGHMWFPKWPQHLAIGRRITRRRDIVFDQGRVLMTRSSHEVISLNLWRYLRKKFERYVRLWTWNYGLPHTWMLRRALRTHRLSPLLASYKWLHRWLNYSRLYLTLLAYGEIELYPRVSRASKKLLEFTLFISFKYIKFVVSLHDNWTNRQHFFLAPGLLIKFFHGQKTFKKKKGIKVATARFLKKMLTIVDAPRMKLAVRGVPADLPLILDTLMKPFTYPYTNPLTGEIIDDTKHQTRIFELQGARFHKLKPFGFQKTRKKGRVKRKVMRKIIKLNKVID